MNVHIFLQYSWILCFASLSIWLATFILAKIIPPRPSPLESLDQTGPAQFVKPTIYNPVILAIFIAHSKFSINVSYFKPGQLDVLTWQMLKNMSTGEIKTNPTCFCTNFLMLIIIGHDSK